MKRLFSAAILVLAFTAVLPAAAQSRSSGKRLVVLPFENAGREATAARWDWVGEALAELSAERLGCPGPRAAGCYSGEGRTVLPRSERLAALERLGLPAAPPRAGFSRATMVKIAEETEADCILFGQYRTDGERLEISARVLRLFPAELSAPLNFSGAWSELIELHGRLAAGALAFLTAAEKKDGGVNPPPQVTRLDALEQYVRGLLATEEQQRLRHLREAARIEPNWALPAFALGQLYFSRRDCDSALIWLSRVPPEHPAGLEAGFGSGVCHLMRRDALRAESAFAAVLAREGSLPEALNNLAVAKLLRGGSQAREAAALLERALEADSEDPDYWFNLGLQGLSTGARSSAARALREVLARKPDDAEAQALLASATGGASASAATSSAAESPAGRERVKLTLDLSRGPAEAGHGPGSDAGGAGQSPRARHTALHVTRGRESLESGDLPRAQFEFGEALLIDPAAGEAHAGLAEIYRRQGRTEDALRALRAALWGGEDARLRLQLARLLLELNRTSEARAELREVLKAEPENAEARALLRSLEARPAGGRP
jgi:tetratricopeptide (TPR) repeat protein